MKAVHNPTEALKNLASLVIAHVKLQNESSSQLAFCVYRIPATCDCSRKITK